MLLNHEDLVLFFRLHRSLMFFVNQRLKVIPDKIANPEEMANLPANVRCTVRDAFVKDLDLIESFVAENPGRFSDDELAIVLSWQHLAFGRFYVFREHAKYTVFISVSYAPVAYGVLALSQPFEEVIGPTLPILVETVLLPFKDKILYDGIMNRYSISFGPGIKRGLNEGFKKAKASHGIVTSLPIQDVPPSSKPPKAKAIVVKPPTNETNDESLSVIVGLIDRFCIEHLNDEYAVLCIKLAEKLGRKRPSPLRQGRPNAWASGIIRAIGGVNFLHDKTQKPFMPSADIDYYLGTSPSSGAAKLAAIRKILGMRPLDPNWTLSSRLEDNPMVWMLRVNGFIMDIRNMPRETQEAAFKKGLIPYIPADR